MKQLRRILLGAAALTLCAGISAAQLNGGNPGVQPTQSDNLLQQLLGGPTLGGGGRANRGARNGGFGGGGGNFGGGGGNFGGGGRGGRGYGGEYLTGNEPLDIPLNRNGIADWGTDPQFKADNFTFVRIRFTNSPRGGGGGFGFGGGGGGGMGHSWLNDWPQADMNVSFRLQQMTALKVNPTPIRLAITDPALLNYPFGLMEQAGIMQLTAQEVPALRRYLLNGGFIMVDDLWGTDQDNVLQQFSRVLPDCKAIELTINHPIFHALFDFKTLPQVPTLQDWEREARDGNPEQSSRRNLGFPPPIYHAIIDPNGRMLVLINNNTDTPDAWEQEGEQEEYFHRFSEKVAYPFMINVVFYAMTH